MRIYTDRFHVGAGTTVGPLSIFPVWSEVEMNLDFTVPQIGNIAIKEQEQPRVDRLVVQNTGREALLLPEGTVVDGGWQTRVVARDVLIIPRASREVSVRCVERGRWGGDDTQQVDGRAPISVVAALRGLGTPGDSQGKVWSRVEKLGEHYGAHSTENLLDMMSENGVGERVGRRPRGAAPTHRSQVRRLDPQMVHDILRLATQVMPGQAGIMVGIAGQPAALELHGNPGVLTPQIAALLRAAILDAHTLDWRPTPGQLARDFAEQIMFTELGITRASAHSQSLAGAGGIADIRAIASPRSRNGSFHISVLNRQHELALAA